MVTAIEIGRPSADPAAYFGNTAGRIGLRAFAPMERGRRAAERWTALCRGAVGEAFDHEER